MENQRNVGLQTVQTARIYCSPKVLSHHSLEKNDYNSFFYTPRTLSTMILFLASLNFLAYGYLDSLKLKTKAYFYDPLNPDVFEDYRWPLFFAFFSIIAFAVTQFPDSIIRRPHPVFWRVFLGLMLSYSCFMTLVLLLPTDKARFIFKIFHPYFGNPLPERGYADDCRVFTPENEISQFSNIYDAVYDVHFIAHLAGWWFKMLIIRDVKLAWITSASFELIEISFRHWLPNFWECWWDHLCLDLFGCNAAGIVLGAMTIKYMGVSRINWIYKKPQVVENEEEKNRGPIARALSKFSPEVVITYDWAMLTSLKRYCQVWFYIFFILSVDAMNFFLKFILFVGAESDLLKARVFIWAFSAIATSKEYYEYLDDPNCARVGPFFWLSCYTLFIEYSVWFKHSRGMFDQPFPWYVKVIMVSYAATVLLGAVMAYWNGKKQKEETNKQRY
jgi:phosphatidylserine synthase 2